MKRLIKLQSTLFNLILLSTLTFFSQQFVWADDNAIMQEFGKYVIERAPENIKNGSNIDKARFLFGAYTDALANKGVYVNDSYLLRAWNAIAHGDRGRWTCADHSQKLAKVFEGAGLPRTQLAYITADSEGKIPPPNNEHGALAFIDGGHFFIFDAWMHAFERGGSVYGFENGYSSKWNGLPVGRWQFEMKKKGYLRFSGNDGASYEPNAIKALQTILAGYKVKEEKAEAIRNKQTGEAGVWVYKNMKPVPLPASENNCYPGRKVTLADGTATFSQGYAPCGGAVVVAGKAESTIHWTFPKTLKPGSGFSVPFWIERKSDPIPLYGGAMAVFYFRGQGDVRGTIELKGRLDDPSFPEKTPIKTLDVPNVPNGKPGDKLTMWVNVSGESGWGDVFYEYEMSSGSAGAGAENTKNPQRNNGYQLYFNGKLVSGPDAAYYTLQQAQDNCNWNRKTKPNINVQCVHNGQNL